MAKVLVVEKASQNFWTVPNCELKMEERQLVVRNVFNDPVVIIPQDGVTAFLEEHHVEIDGHVYLLLDKSWRGF